MTDVALDEIHARAHARAWWTARLRGYEAMTILADEAVLSTPGFAAA